MVTARPIITQALQNTLVLLLVLLFAAAPIPQCRAANTLHDPDFQAVAENRLSLQQHPDPYLRICIEPRTLQTNEAQSCGRTIAQQLPDGLRFEAPLDLAAQYRVPLDFCADYWPEHESGKTLADFCADEYYYGWQLQQSLRPTPFYVAREQVEIFNSDPHETARRAAFAAAYWWLSGHDVDALQATIIGSLADENLLRNAIAVEVGADRLLAVAPESLWQITPDDSSIAADLSVSSALSYNSAASTTQMLTTAADRGIQAVVIADSGHIGGAQEARRIAARLKREGRLPADFAVITGEHIRCLGGSVTAIGISTRVPESMTFERTIKEIHRQGGVVFLNHPGKLGGSDLLHALDVDGYFIQPGIFELFRTLNLLYDPALADKPALYGSHARFSQAVGLPYSAVMAATADESAILEALRNQEAYAAGNLYFPLMGMLAIQPLAVFETTLNGYFQGHEWLTAKAREILNADHVIMTTTWDETIRDIMSLGDTSGDLRHVLQGDSPLEKTPRVTMIAAQYGAVQVEYRRDSGEVWLRSRFSF